MSLIIIYQIQISLNLKDSPFMVDCYELLCGSVYLDHNNIHIKLLISNVFEQFQNDAYENLDEETRNKFSDFLHYLRKNYFKSDGRFFLGKYSNYADLCRTNRPVFTNNGSGQGPNKFKYFLAPVR